MDSFGLSNHTDIVWVCVFETKYEIFFYHIIIISQESVREFRQRCYKMYLYEEQKICVHHWVSSNVWDYILFAVLNLLTMYLV